jgi:hypothetical protein
MNELIVKGDLYAGPSLVTLALRDMRAEAGFECAFSVN